MGLFSISISIWDICVAPKALLRTLTGDRFAPPPLRFEAFRQDEFPWRIIAWVIRLLRSENPAFRVGKKHQISPVDGNLIVDDRPACRWNRGAQSGG